MDLLRQIVEEPVDPGYAEAAAAGTNRKPRWRLGFAVAAILIGALITISVLQNSQSAPIVADERRELINRIVAAETEQDQLRARTNELGAEIEQLRASALGGDAEAKRLEQRITEADAANGGVPVRGPGLSVIVDDAPGDSADTRDRVLDLDLQILVNGLWQVGAEAVTVNGHRLSTLTSIRSAGEAITVDYRSLTRPYRVEAITDPDTSQQQFVQTHAGLWWNELMKSRGMRYELSTVKEISMDADPGLSLRHAERARPR
jgi:uncharacterized protein YlxW (UPF0749 family)